jgi:nickel transport protein
MKHFLRLKPILTASVLLFMVTSGVAFAHRVVIFAWIEGDTVFTESQFPDGRKISDARVKVFDHQNNLLLEGTTDENGEFSFEIPKITDLNIVLEAGMGHRGQWPLSEAEIKSAMGVTEKSPASDTMAGDSRDPAADTFAPKVASQTKETGRLVNEKELAQIVETAVEKALEKNLDKKLQPVTRMLARMQDSGPSVNDIFGGIGYIIGLMGVAAFFLSKSKSRNND